MLWSTERMRLLQAVTASTLAAPLALPPAAEADSQVTLRPAAGPPATVAVLVGRRFPEGRPVKVHAADTALGRERADARGRFRLSVSVPGEQSSAWRLRAHSGRARVTSIFARSTSSTVAEVASSTGRRLRWGPVTARPGAAVRLRGFGFRPRERVRLSLFARVTKLRASRRGRIRLELEAPHDAGRRRGAVRAGGVSLPLSVTIAPEAAPSQPGAAPPAPPGVRTGSLSAGGDPLIAAAGDIACDPTVSTFLGGPGSCRHRETSDLLLDPAIDAVLPLGDLQYEQATLAQFMASYDPSWGRVKSITRPIAGNHEYMTNGAAG
jgi:hypothetical protein